MKLESAWTVGGVVVDESGVPVPGVTVKPSVDFRKRPGDERAFGVGARETTDAEGKWQFDMVPDGKNEVWVEVSHKDFMPHRLALSREVYGLSAGQEPVAKIELPSGLTIRGKVTDSAGKPIADALIRTKFLNDLRSATTDKDGKYAIHGCEERNTRVVVSAKGYAVDMAKVRVHDKMEPVDFKMQPGGHVKIRVVDENGKGLPRARIFYQGWRGWRFGYFEFDHVSQYADENGVWEWNEAPLDEFEVDICNPKGMQLSDQKIIARPEEYVFRPPPHLIVSGIVTDAKTKERLPKFRVVPGIQGSEGGKIDWVSDETLKARDGNYRLRHIDEGCFAHYVRIDAEGYQPQISRPIKSDEGNVKLFFKMQPGENVKATVLDTSGDPVNGASVVLGVPGTQISFKNGRVKNGSTYNAVQRTTNEAGGFEFPPQVTSYEIVIVADEGYAHLKPDSGRVRSPVTLTPWARLEGKYFVGKVPAVNVDMYVSNDQIHSYGETTPNIFMHFDATTGKDGSFLFDRIPVGRTYIQREIVRMVGEGATEVTSTPRVVKNLESGKTTRVTLGGSGSIVTGKLVPSKLNENVVDWKHGGVGLEVWTPQPPIPDEITEMQDLQAWYKEWSKTEAGKQWEADEPKRRKLSEESIRFNATVAKDGRFRIDDVPPGKYTLSASSKEESSHGIVVEVADESPIDVGTIQLK